jgi:hypothetical protein
MKDERALAAMRRIERAISRIEAAAGKAPPPRDDQELRQLREVHQALRGKVEGAISQIDRLLATEESV